MTIVLTWQRLALGAVLVALVAFAVAGWVVNPVEQVVDHGAAPVARSVGIASSPADVNCLTGWAETTGKDPDGNIKMKVCTSPDKRYVITIRENEAPIGFDGAEARFLTPGEVAAFIR